MNEFLLGNHKVGKGEKPFIIAEMSGNHNQSLDRALKIVDIAAETGVQALKIQTYTADTMTLDLHGDEFFISDSKNLWKGKSLHELYKEAYTPWEWHAAIFDRCKKHGIVGFSTPFDATAVDFLEELNVPFYKIASFENADLPLIRKVAATKKPIIMSTGMATASEVDEAVTAAREAGCEHMVLLKCTSTYPATPKDTNLLSIPHMRELFPTCQIGLSDHTMGVGVSLAAIALGATVIEKHFTLLRADGGVDSTFSMEPDEMKLLVNESNRVVEALGKVSYGPTESEKRSRVYRRSLYVTRDMKAGDKFSIENLRSIRPGAGLAPKYYETLIGAVVTRDVKRGTPASWDLIKP